MPDLTTLLSKFLNDLYAGTLGVTMPISKILLGDGSAAAPALAFASNPDTGLYYSAPNSQVRLVYDGAAAYLWSASQYTLNDVSLGFATGGVVDVSLSRGAANVLTLASGDRMSFGGVTASFPMIRNTGAQLDVVLADESAWAFVNARGFTSNTDGYYLASKIAISNTAPTVTSAGTSPSIVTNGTVAWRANIGTGGSATTLVVAMPAATTGWNCEATNLTAAAANRANQRVEQQSSTTTSVTLQNQLVSTGAAQAFTASDIVSAICFAY